MAHVKKGVATQLINTLLVSLHSLEERKPRVDAGVTAAFWGMINYQPKLLCAWQGGPRLILWSNKGSNEKQTA